MNAILLVDSWPVVTSGLRNLLHDAGFENVIRQTHSVKEATQLAGDNLALLVFDPAMPDTTPETFVTQMRRKQPRLPILFFSSQAYGFYLSLAHVLGVSGYLNKASDGPTIVAAIRMALSGMQCFPQAGAYPGQGAAMLRKLSPRELMILQLLRQGMRNKDIAERLYLSPKTVSTHKQALLRKLGVNEVVATYLGGPAGVDQPIS